MITGIVVFLFVIAAIASANNGEWGPLAVCGVIIVLVLFCKVLSLRDDRAYNNFMDYWSKGGPDRK